MNTGALKFAANLSMLYGHLPLLERPAAAAAAGFEAAEIWWPFDSPVPADRDVDALTAALSDAGLQLVAMNFLEGDMRAGDRGLLSVPSRADQFRDSIATAVDFADRTGCRVLNALYGNRQPETDHGAQDELALENLVAAARAAHQVKASVVLETISRQEAPDYPLSDADATVAMADRVNEAAGLSNTGFLCDLYHHGRNGEDIPALLQRHEGRIVHFQIADTPGRGRPGSGVLDYPAFFALIDAAGYDGWIGLEYEPTRDAKVDFDWLPSLTARA
ncbi:hydroxypyruvate isomerase family protein [Streptomyces sp. NPDC051018]|uniref:hydroxypyruvate isomerase family protein n=1 Tax=Streptomyces sp. NPDC051018 TaxID=3365639 RepID=UPI003790FB9C